MCLGASSSQPCLHPRPWWPDHWPCHAPNPAVLSPTTLGPGLGPDPTLQMPKRLLRCAQRAGWCEATGSVVCPGRAHSGVNELHRMQEPPGECVPCMSEGLCALCSWWSRQRPSILRHCRVNESTHVSPVRLGTWGAGLGTRSPCPSGATWFCLKTQSPSMGPEILGRAGMVPKDSPFTPQREEGPPGHGIQGGGRPGIVPTRSSPER